jgi:uncharacterized membrane protein YgaE (UPF0421/DUF939 family)
MERMTNERMPLELREQLDELEDWAKRNYNAGRKDTIAFWSLKTPAIIAASSAGVFAHFKLTLASLFVGAIASICVIIDGVNPRGMLRNIHMRAFHDIGILIRRMTLQWRARSPEANDDKIASRILRASQAPYEQIAKYIRDAETALNSSSRNSR